MAAAAQEHAASAISFNRHAQVAGLPTDFVLYGSLDVVIVLNQGAHPVIASGWIFDCRSGLRPVLERVGSVSMLMVRDGDQSAFFPNVRVEAATARPDVLAAYGAACPSMGQETGYTLIADIPPPSGGYVVYVAWATWDGAGHAIQHVSSPSRVVVP
jgi:hypothetical protein